MASIGGEAKPLHGEVLPTRGEVYQHYLHILNTKIKTGDWGKFTPLTSKVKFVMSDIKSIWEKTGIPHLSGQSGEARVEKLISDIKRVNKIPMKQRNDASTLKQIGDLQLDILFDISKCQCVDPSSCRCPDEDKVPAQWRPFLRDQRGERRMATYLGERMLSLRWCHKNNFSATILTLILLESSYYSLCFVESCY